MVNEKYPHNSSQREKELQQINEDGKIDDENKNVTNHSDDSTIGMESQSPTSRASQPEELPICNDKTAQHIPSTTVKGKMEYPK